MESKSGNFSIDVGILAFASLGNLKLGTPAAPGGDRVEWGIAVEEAADRLRDSLR